jgi:hypothetical protein
MKAFRNVKAAWKRLETHEPGERFGAFYREQKDKPFWVKATFLGLAVLSFAVGVVLAFIPGPAVVFFALSGALLSTQSRWIAEALDHGELWGRKQFAALKAWYRRKRRGRAGPRKTGHARG